MRRPVFGKPLKTKRVPAYQPKNPSEAARNKQQAVSAIGDGLCLTLTYHGYHRVVEVHTVGTTTAGRPAMSAFQVDGQSETPPVPDWGLFCFDECFNVALSNIPSSAPRPDYKKRAKQFRLIDREV
ncbi:hypothetical protein VSX60_08685 [Aurantimonas sp. A3-2-R12]|nr:hypothetical protein [Aurantimonas sp. A3-2-R12]